MLQKGLSFCPVGKFDTFVMDIDLERFFRAIRLKVYFAQDRDSEVPEVNEDIVSLTPETMTLDALGLRLRSMYLPPKNSHPVETFVYLVKKDMGCLFRNIEKGDYHIRDNMTREEKDALKVLLNDDSIIVKPADKGGSIEIMDHLLYIREIECQLADSDTSNMTS